MGSTNFFQLMTQYILVTTLPLCIIDSFQGSEIEAGLAISAAILGLGFGALSPAFQTLAIQSVPAERTDAATATYFWFLDVFVGLAAMLLGFVAKLFGYMLLYGGICTAVTAAAMILYYFLFTRSAQRT